jgi:hypothetical protein
LQASLQERDAEEGDAGAERWLAPGAVAVFGVGGKDALQHHGLQLPHFDAAVSAAARVNKLMRHIEQRKRNAQRQG